MCSDRAHVKHNNAGMPPVELLRQRVQYDPETGVFCWRSCGPEHFDGLHAWKVWTAKFAGRPVGKRCRGYLVISISHGGRTVYCQGHRAAWALMTGAWPEGEIDHADGERGNNRWTNLRPASHRQNQWNKGRSRLNRSGFKGVHLHTQLGRWVAQISVDGVTRHLGLFDKPEEAAAAYQAAATDQHQQFARFQ